MRPATISHLTHQLQNAINQNDATRAHHYGLLLNQHDTPPATSCHAAALWYAQQGLRVFPLQPTLKTPYSGSRGCSEATSNPTIISAWWETHPHANVAIATGHLIDVIDIDGATGVKAIAAMLNHLPPIHGKVSTPRPGGTHLYVAAVNGHTNKAGLMPGVDYRGKGGYVVAPPSINPAGVRYRWTRDLNLARTTLLTQVQP